MAKVKKTNVYPEVLLSLLDRFTITDVSDLERTRSATIAGLVEFLNPGVQVLIDKIFSGNVYWTGVELEHRSTVIRYAIASQQYQAPITDLVLEDAHDTLDRIDLFVVTTDSEVVIITGEPAVNPQEPPIFHEKQLKVSFVYIPADSTIPLGGETEQVYNEFLQEPDEWNTSAPPEALISNIDLEYGLDPDLDSKHILIKGLDEYSVITFKKDTTTPVLNFSSLNFRLRTRIRTDFYIKASFFNGSSSVGSATIINNTFGLDVTYTDDYQTISVPAEMFALSASEFDVLTLTFLSIGGSDAYTIYIDDVKLIYGGDNPNVLQTYLSLTDTFDDSYIGKAGYNSIVNNQETGLVLKSISLHDIEDCLVRKKDGNVDYDLIESGDTVYFKEVDNNTTLIGWSYKGGGANKLLRASYTKITSIA